MITLVTRLEHDKFWEETEAQQIVTKCIGQTPIRARAYDVTSFTIRLGSIVTTSLNVTVTLSRSLSPRDVIQILGRMTKYDPLCSCNFLVTLYFILITNYEP